MSHTSSEADTTNTDITSLGDTDTDTDTSDRSDGFDSGSTESDIAGALFRAHATARLQGRTAEALELAVRIGDSRRMSHTLFVLALFAQIVVDEFGTRPDPENLAEFTRLLHDHHYKPGSGFSALRAEAMIRAVTAEPELLNEIPFGEQPGLMWTVMRELIESDTPEADLALLLDTAEERRTELLKNAFESTFAPLKANPAANTTTPSPAAPSATTPSADTARTFKEDTE